MRFYNKNLIEVSSKVSHRSRCMILYAMINCKWEFSFDEDVLDAEAYDDDYYDWEKSTRTVVISSGDTEALAFICKAKNLFHKCINELIEVGFMKRVKRSTYLINMRYMNNYDMCDNNPEVDDDGLFM